MEYRDYYEILGVPRKATQPEIKKAFRKLAREHHPDLKPGDKAAEQRFKDVNEAHAVLGDAAKRKQYDALGRNWDAFERAGGAARPGARHGSGPFAGSGGGGNVHYEFRTAGGEDLGGFSDFFRMVFGAGAPGAQGDSASGGTRRGSTATGSFDDILSGMGIDGATAGGGRRRAPARSTGAEATAELTLEEAFNGTSRLVEIGGKRLEVTIPRGVDGGNRIRLSGKGPDGSDLDVVVRVTPHAAFTRRGADLERELPITLAEALLGAEVPVQTLKGRLVLTIPRGTQSGRTFRLTGQGMPRFKAAGSGDLFVRTRVVLPASLSDEAEVAGRRFLDLVDQPNPRTPTA